MRDGWPRAVLAGITVALVTAATATGGSVVATPISSDPYTNQSSQHRTQVEPDSFGFGNTVVATFQTGRFNAGGGSSNIGWATTTNAGRTWTTGMLPDTTIYQGGPWSRISDPAVAYDPMHDVWMISTLAFGMSLTPFGAPSAILTSRSTDGGLTWQSPVTTSLGATNFYDKNWITCDSWLQSPHYGSCYTEWDDNGLGNRILMSTSIDGGQTWSPPVSPGGLPSGLGGQPVVQPNGTVVVPYTTGNEIRGVPFDGRGRQLDEAACRSTSSRSTRSPGISAPRRFRRPRSTPKVGCTSSGRTAASAPGAARTTS